MSALYRTYPGKTTLAALLMLKIHSISDVQRGRSHSPERPFAFIDFDAVKLK